MVAAPALTRLALRFGPAEYFALVVFGLVVLAVLSSGSTLRAMALGAFGLLLGTVGLEPMSGFARFTFGRRELFDGFGFIPVAMGLFGLGEILDKVARTEQADVVRGRLAPLAEPRGLGAELEGCAPRQRHRVLLRPAARSQRGDRLDRLLWPGEAPLAPSGRVRARRHRGRAGPESANNAAAAGALVPLLSLGIPSSPPTAVLLAGFLIHGLTPGPLLMQQRPDVFWGALASMYIGNAMLRALRLRLPPHRLRSGAGRAGARAGAHARDGAGPGADPEH